MLYSVSKITSAADCDLLLSWSAKEKADLIYKKLSEERDATNYSETSVEIAAELQSVSSEISATETILTGLPDGNTKDDMAKKKVKLEYKKFLLENRKDSYGSVALLQKELELAKVTRELEEIDAFNDAINARKAEL